jgi:hypothetical protein
MSPRALAARLHLHTREDEYSFDLEGQMGACSATMWSRPGPATWSSSPATSGTPSGTQAKSPGRILEIIFPAGFEHFFRELSDMGGAINADPDQLTALGARYGHYFKLESVPELVERFGLRIGEPLSGGWTA